MDTHTQTHTTEREREREREGERDRHDKQAAIKTPRLIKSLDRQKHVTAHHARTHARTHTHLEEWARVPWEAAVDHQGRPDRPSFHRLEPYQAPYPEVVVAYPLGQAQGLHGAPSSSHLHGTENGALGGAWGGVVGGCVVLCWCWCQRYRCCWCWFCACVGVVFSVGVSAGVGTGVGCVDVGVGVHGVSVVWWWWRWCLCCAVQTPSSAGSSPPSMHNARPQLLFPRGNALYAKECIAPAHGQPTANAPARSALGLQGPQTLTGILAQ